MVWWAKRRGKPNPLLKIGEADHGNRDGETIFALKDVSFSVKQGETLGIIGRNGAGKSTLLKILSRVTAPTSGQVKVKGRIASLLEVGTGFHADLTGRENIYLNGAILGMARYEVRRKLDEIVDFSGVEKFIDTPVKRYSSGMYVRLAFAVAAHLDPEVLIVDEVLAVGDTEFQKKCLGKIGDIAHQGRTVLFVSHNMISVKSLCESVILLNAGKIELLGGVDDVVNHYIMQTSAHETDGLTISDISGQREGDGKMIFRKWWIDDDIFGKGRKARSCQKCTFRIIYQSNICEPLKDVSVTLTIRDNYGNPVFSGATWFVNSDFGFIPPTGILSCKFNEFPLTPGIYSVYFYCSVQNEMADRITNAGTFEVIAEDIYKTGKIPENKHGNVIIREFSWSVTE
jgi:lipopolysaccharide transport system ATP-binding protein